MAYDGPSDLIFPPLVRPTPRATVPLTTKNAKTEESNADNEALAYHLGCVPKGMEWVLHLIIAHYHDHSLTARLSSDLLNIWTWPPEIRRGSLERISLGILNVTGSFPPLFKNATVIGTWLHRKSIWFYLLCVYFACTNVCKLCNYIRPLFSFRGVQCTCLFTKYSMSSLEAVHAWSGSIELLI